MRVAFERLGGKCVFSSEIHKYAKKTYEANFSDEPKGDIKKIPASTIPDHDILLAGWPCPSFSIMGKKQGLEDERGALFFEIERILKKKKPKAFLLENVKLLSRMKKGEVLLFIEGKLHDAGYYTYTKVLNALNFGLPQKRERTIIVGFLENYEFEFPEGRENSVDLSEILEPEEDVDEKYVASEHIRESRMEEVEGDEIFHPSIWHENKAGNVSILPYSVALRANASYNYLLVNGERLPTPREMLRLQGFPENFEVKGPYTQIRRQVGRSVPIPMIEDVGKEMLKAMKRKEILPVQTKITTESEP